MLATAATLATSLPSIHIEASASAGQMATGSHAPSIGNGYLLGAVGAYALRMEPWIELQFEISGQYLGSSHGGFVSSFSTGVRFRTTSDNAFFIAPSVGALRIDDTLYARFEDLSSTREVTSHAGATLPVLRLALGSIVDLGTIDLVVKVAAFWSPGGKVDKTESELKTQDPVVAAGACFEVGARFDL